MKRFQKLKDNGEKRGQAINIISQTVWPCDFQDGKCDAEHAGEHELFGTQGRGCCSFCADTNGYHEEGVFHKRFWDVKTGYWRKGIGCILPRDKRSHICTYFVCSHLKQKEPHFAESIGLLEWWVLNGKLARITTKEIIRRLKSIGRFHEKTS